MPTTQHTDPTTIAYDATTNTLTGAARAARRADGSRVAQALADRINGMTWREVALRHGYRGAGAAEYNVGRYVAWLNGHTATSRTTARTGAPAMSTRRFGVEIEFTGCTMQAAAIAISDALGRHISRTGYHGAREWSEWRVERDGSVSSSNGIGGECVSPVLSGQAGLDEVVTVVNAIRSVGGRVDRRTGVHVHIDATDLTGEQIARTLCAYVDRQPAFNRMVSPSRRCNGYCGPYSESEKDATVEALKTYRDASMVTRKYRTVNVTTLGRTGTVEFRQHQGSLNGTKITAWVKTLLALVQAVTDTADEHLPFDGEALIDALTAHGLDAAARRHMTRRLVTTA